jgi:hypothetical protein
MATTRVTLEPYQLSPRFYRAMQVKALSLEVDALRDELAVATLAHRGHVRRQRLLVQAQRDEAERLRDFLARTTIQEEL